jgi:hypothetical protein
MFIFVVQTLQKKWNEICLKKRANRKMYGKQLFFEDLEVRDVLHWIVKIANFRVMDDCALHPPLCCSLCFTLIIKKFKVFEYIL